MGLTRSELRALAAVGMAAKLRAIEAQLADAFKMFPEVFVSKTPPVLVRPELRNGRSKDWPTIEATATGKRTTTTRRGGFSTKVKRQRAQSARLLSAVEGGANTAKALSTAGYRVQSVGALIRRGYLKRTKDGYARTAKSFAVELKKAS